MSWIPASIYALLSGIALCAIVDLSLLWSAQEDAIGSAAKAIAFAFPVGNAAGVALYRWRLVGSLSSLDGLGVLLALVLATVGAFGGLIAMDRLGSGPGLVMALAATCAGSVAGYSLALGGVKK